MESILVKPKKQASKTHWEMRFILPREEHDAFERKARELNLGLSERPHTCQKSNESFPDQETARKALLERDELLSEFQSTCEMMTEQSKKLDAERGMREQWSRERDRLISQLDAQQQEIDYWHNVADARSKDVCRLTAENKAKAEEIERQRNVIFNYDSQIQHLTAENIKLKDQKCTCGLEQVLQERTDND